MDQSAVLHQVSGNFAVFAHLTSSTPEHTSSATIKKATYSFPLPTRPNTAQSCQNTFFLSQSIRMIVRLKHLNSSKSFHHAKTMRVFICDSMLTSSGSKYETNTKNKGKHLENGFSPSQLVLLSRVLTQLHGNKPTTNNLQYQQPSTRAAEITQSHTHTFALGLHFVAWSVFEG